MRELTLPEHAGHLHLIPLFQKLHGVPDEVAQIVFCDARRDLYTLYFLLRLLLILPRLGFQVLVLPEVDDLGDRRRARRGDEDEVETRILGGVQGLAARENAQLLVVGADDAQLAMLEQAAIDLRGRLLPYRPTEPARD